VSSALPIVTLTLNPAVDYAIEIPTFEAGRINRGTTAWLDPGGKGINASRVIWRMKRLTLAVGFVGGPTGAMIRARLGAEGVPYVLLEVRQMTRINVMVHEIRIGRRSRLYLPGPRITPRDLASIWEMLSLLPTGTTLIMGGSIPPGLPTTIYRDLTRNLAARGISVVVDASGPALAAVLPAHPMLIKPNVEEAAEVLQRPLTSDAEVLEAAVELRKRGASNVVISQGAHGAIGVGTDGCWKAIPPAVTARSTVGSGDSMVAGMAIVFNEGGQLADALRLGTAAGAATAMTPGTRLCRAADVQLLLPHVRLLPLGDDASGPAP
jgi:6-phosphofructokinase 2